MGVTLAEWAKTSKYAVRRHPSGAWWYPDTDPLGSSGLWKLDDYVVSSVTGGSIWLVPREEA